MLCDSDGFERLLGWLSCCDQDGGDGATHHQLLYQLYGKDLRVGISLSILNPAIRSGLFKITE